MILEPKKIMSVIVSTFSPYICHDGTRCHDLWFLNVELYDPITSWQIDGETVETVEDLILGGSKIIADGDCSHEIKRRLLLGRKVMTNLDSILETLLCQQRSV